MTEFLSERDVESVINEYLGSGTVSLEDWCERVATHKLWSPGIGWVLSDENISGVKITVELRRSIKYDAGRVQPPGHSPSPT